MERILFSRLAGPIGWLMLLGVLAATPARAEHSVLLEACSSTVCPHCAEAAEQTEALVAAGAHDFVHVALVSNMNTYAWRRSQELGVSGVPHYVFDGGFDEWVGSGSLPAAYVSRLELSAERIVADIELIVEPVWEAAGLIRVDVRAVNHGTEPYAGRLRAMVAEIESRWKTSTGNPFHNAMVGDYAINVDVTIPAGDAVSLSEFWDGFDEGFVDLLRENSIVVAALHDATTGYVDEATRAMIPDPNPDVAFIRGDANADGRPDLSDAVFTLNHLFIGGAAPVCKDAADTDDSGTLDITDAVRLLNHLFLGGPAPDSPFPDCGPDATDDGLSCPSFPPCDSV